MIAWTNYFVRTTRAFATEGHINAEDLRTVIQLHDGGEAYHGAFDLEPRPDFSNYIGLVRPALGYVWFDLDSHDGGIQALADSRALLNWFGDLASPLTFYSGSKGFHIAIPFGAFSLAPSTDLHKRLHRFATALKEKFPSLDTTIYNANRKFRALGSKHPKTGLYKIAITSDDLELGLEHIKECAKVRRSLEIPLPPLCSALPHVVALLDIKSTGEIKSKAEKKNWKAPKGEAAFEKCSFLKFVKEEPTKVSEPQWYAALSVVSRFQEGRKQCHVVSNKHPKYTVSECNSKIDQALSESAPRTCENISGLWSGCQVCPLYQKINSPVNIPEMRFWDIGEKGRRFPQYDELLREFITQYPYKTIADMKTVYVFKETHYEEYTPIEIKAFAEEQFEPKPQEKNRQEFAHKVLANSVTKRQFFTDSTANRINFKNGILHLGDRNKNQLTLQNHSPEIGFRGVLPYSYIENFACPTFDWWLKDVMLGDEELIKILQEFMGYVVRGGDYKYHKALWLSGSGRNGKSTFLSVLKALIGTGNYSTLSIRQIIGDKFSSSDLDGKIANFSEETSPEELSDSGPFKNLTGDGELLAQKKYGDPYSFRNRAKLIMTYNEIPILKDLSPGMLSRPLIIPFKKDLTNESHQDQRLKDKLLAELPGIFNFALRGWERLEEQGAFTQSEKSKVSLLDIQTASCSALRWISEQVRFVAPPAGRMYTATALYEAYSGWQRERALGKTNFFRRIAYHPEMAARRHFTKNATEYHSLVLGEKEVEF